MNTSFEKSKNSTDEWYTPKEIIDALGEFDLDPCAIHRVEAQIHVICNLTDGA